jgi:hypothetical protein
LDRGRLTADVQVAGLVLAGFATTITVIAAAVISWEHMIVNARTAGLVEFEVESR